MIAICRYMESQLKWWWWCRKFEAPHDPKTQPSFACNVASASFIDWWKSSTQLPSKGAIFLAPPSLPFPFLYPSFWIPFCNVDITLILNLVMLGFSCLRWWSTWVHGLLVNPRFGGSIQIKMILLIDQFSIKDPPLTLNSCKLYIIHILLSLLLSRKRDKTNTPIVRTFIKPGRSAGRPKI